LDCFLGRKVGTAVAVRKGIPHNLVDLPPLVSVEATRFYIRIGNSKVLRAAVYMSPEHAGNDAGIIELLSFRHKLLLAGDLNAEHPFWNSVVSNPSGTKLLNSQHINEFEISAPQCLTITLLREIVSWLILLCTRMSDCQKSLSLTFWTQITYQSFSTYWNLLELGVFWTQLTNSQLGSGFKAWPLN
jgi:hypothetical protein